MIIKEPRGYKDLYNLRIIDKNNNSFVMTVGGNGDLYWLPENHKICTNYIITKEDEFTYEVFRQLFEAVKKRDDKYLSVLKGNVITFISEDRPSDEANILKIIKNDDDFTIDFVRNEDMEKWTTLHHASSNICFCNSGSRVPRVEQLFMILFNNLAYHCDEIEEVM